MKTFGIIHILLFLLLMLVYQCAGAQDFLITTRGDSVAGETRLLMHSSEKKVVITDTEKKKTTYSIFQIRKFSSRNEMYVPVRTTTGYTFMKVVKPGYLSLLNYQLENQVVFQGEYLLRQDGQGMEVPNLAFKKNIAKFLADCPEVVQRIEAGELGKSKIELIVDEYNTCVAKRTAQQMQASVEQTAVQDKLSVWNSLESKIKAKEEFAGKQDALEMVAEIKSKINRNEKVPGFIIEGLRSSLAEAQLSDEFNDAVKSLQN
jgi:hypothetical protein